MNNGISIGINFLTFCAKLPSLKSEPRDTCAFIILLVSSNIVGINLSEIDNTSAKVEIGTPTFCRNPRLFSIALVISVGEVVAIKTTIIATTKINLTVINAIPKSAPL